MATYYSTLRFFLLLYISLGINQVLNAQAVNFSYTGGVQTYTVPPCVTSITVDVRGAQGGGPNGGNGARVTGTIPVTPGQVLYIYVGGQGGCPGAGFNGGGNGQSVGGGFAPGCGGGGASDIRTGTALSTRLVVAAGGGGRGGGNTNAGGGAGGCTTGNAGFNSFGGGGGGGTQSNGGAGGPGWAGLGQWGQPGSLGQGGNGAPDLCFNIGPGGGGGGGYYGGGGGGSDCWPGGPLGGGGGGGGSSLIPSGGSCQVGFNPGNGFVSITPNFSATAGTASANPSAVCSGQSSTITLTGHQGTIQWQISTNNGATWSNIPGATSTTLNTGPLTANTCYRAAVTCGNTVFSNMVCVTVAAIPTANFTINPTNACTNANVTLSFTGSAPTGSTFNWSCGGCAPAPTGSNPTVSWSSAVPATKTVTLVVTGPAPTNCQSAPFTATVNIVAPPTSSFTVVSPVCENANSTITYTGNAPANSTFTWNCNGCNPAPGNTVGPWTVSWSTAGTKTLTLTVVGPPPTSCVSAQTTVLATVNPIPNPAFTINPSTICINSNTTITYTGTVLQGASYSWNCNGCSPSPTGQGPHTVSWATTGTKTVTLQVTGPPPTNCISTVHTVLVTVNPLPLTDFTASGPVCINSSVPPPNFPNANNSTVQLTSPPEPAPTTYTWNFGQDASPPTANTPGPFTNAIQWSTAGTKTITLTVTRPGCIPVSSTQTVLVQPLPTATFTATSTVCATGGNANNPITATVDFTGTLNIPQNNGASTGHTFTWSCDGCVQWSAPNSPPTSPPAANQQHQLTWNTAGTKTLSLTLQSGGCVATLVTQMVTVNPVPTSTFSLSVDSVCGTASVNWSYTGQLGTAPHVFTWDCSNCIGGPPSFGNTNFNISWAQHGIKPIVLTVTSAGCTSLETVDTVKVSKIPVVNLAASPNQVCENTNA
ncbi:MAG: glycine-rich protein, partial [Bacteroidia bacterium]|nr:glycine-rich protein [Bacteroidia bacterium]